MIIPKHFLLSLVFSIFQTLNAQILVGDADLQVNIQNNLVGAELSGISSNGNELMKSNSYLFYLYITKIATQVETRISATSEWGNVDVNNDGTDCILIFTNPSNANLPATLTVTFTLHVSNGKSQWDLSVTGIGGEDTLTRVNFPKFEIKMDGDDTYFLPKFSGVEIQNPFASNIDYELTYPRGRLGASMPYSAYYNENYGMYLGFHDANASLKDLVVQSENDYVKFYGRHSIPNKTLANNNWELPGIFEFDIFQGNWYDATMIYKDWVTNNANYYPQDSPERNERLTEIGNISVWGTAFPALDRPVSQTEQDINDFIDLFPEELSVGIHWYKWYNDYHDDNYPIFFPERDGFEDAVNNIQQGNDVVMPYINGMLYDVDLPNYDTDGYPYAAKKSDGTTYDLQFSDTSEGQAPNTFAMMCPTQTPWQDVLIDANNQLTNRLQTKAVYIDMVGWAGAVECMDATHGHTLASGSWWFDGYHEMFNKFYDAIPTDRFLTVEGATDNLADIVDGFLVQGWQTDGIVPAFQTIYAGKNQFFGSSYGGSTYNNASFYSKFSNAFVNNIQLGRYFLWFAHDADAVTARPYVIELAIMRHKLLDYMAFGTLLRPFETNEIIPEITSHWSDAVGDVTISAVQKNVYRSKEGNSIAFVFSNASMTEDFDFSFDIDGSLYGFNGDLDVRQITQDSDGVAELQSNTFTQNVSLGAMHAVAYIVSEHDALGTEEILNYIGIYPNPGKDIIRISSKNLLIEKLTILNIQGQVMKQLTSITGEKDINISNFASGMYLIHINTAKGNLVRKIIKQ